MVKRMPKTSATLIAIPPIVPSAASISDALLGPEPGEDRVHPLGGQILVIVLVHLHDRGGAARAETLDFAQGEEAVLGGLSGRDSEPLLHPPPDAVRSHDEAGDRAADLQVVLADRLQVDHG